MIPRNAPGRSRTFGALARLLFTALMVAGLLVPAGVLARQDDATPAGDYLVVIGREDIPTTIAQGASYKGRWRLGFHADGTWVAERLDVGVVVEGTWAVDGSTLTVTDESGLLSCANEASGTIDSGDLSTGTYQWERTDDGLTLTEASDGCRGRVVLLTAHPLSPFSACTSEPTPAALPEASPVAVGSPVAASAPAASPQAVTALSQADADAAFDTFTEQLTACWATGDPDRWLALLTPTYRAELVESDPGFERSLGLAMGTAVSWERSGDASVDGPGEISAMVKTTTDGQEDYQRYRLVLDDGAWRWDG